MAVGKVRTGVILIALGVLLLLNTTGIVSFGFWSALGKLWPVILIAIGIEKIFSSSDSLKPLAWFSPLIIVGVVAYAMVAGGWDNGGHSWDWQWDRDVSSGDSDVYSWSESLTPGVERLDLAVAKSAERLIVRGGAPAGTMLEARLTYRGDRPDITSETNGNRRVVRVEDGRNTSSRSRDQWIIKLTDSVPVDLSLDGGSARTRLDLATVRLENLDISTGAADLDITLGTLAPQVNCRINCAASSVDVTVPAGAGVRLDNQKVVLSGLSTGNLELTERDGYLESPDYDSRSVRITLQIRSSAATVRLHTAAVPGTDAT